MARVALPLARTIVEAETRRSPAFVSSVAMATDVRGRLCLRAVLGTDRASLKQDRFLDRDAMWLD